MRMSFTALFLALSVLARPAAAHVALEATLDTAQEVPAPTGTNAGAGGTATFELDLATLALSYMVTLQGLTSDPALGHLHLGARGVAGGVVVALPSLPPANGSVSGTVVLPANSLQDLFAGKLYINFHTAQNLG